MIWQRLCLLILLPLHLWGDLEDTVSLESDSANYHGNVFTLYGHVWLKHHLGEMRAEEARLMALKPGDAYSFQVLNLLGEVSLTLSDQGTLSCENAEINYDTLKAKFWGMSQRGAVNYRSALPDSTIVSLRSDEMYVDLKADKEKRHFSFSKVNPQGNVHLDYGAQFIASSDFASYNTSTANLSLGMKKKTESCRILRKNGDNIYAKTIHLNEAKKEVYLHETSGTLFYEEARASFSPTHFSSRDLTWKYKQHTLLLEKDVVIQSPLYELYTNRYVEVSQRNINNKMEWANFKAFGNASLHHTAQNGTLRSLETHQYILVDNIKLEAILTSPPNEQVLYTDPRGTVRADRVNAYFERIGGHNELSKLHLQENVRIFNYQTDQVEQYALADIVEYNPDDERMTLTAHPGKRVLYYDALNNIQLSAKQIELRRNELNGKTAAQAFGHVKITLNKEEMELIKERFL